MKLPLRSGPVTSAAPTPNPPDPAPVVDELEALAKRRSDLSQRVIEIDQEIAEKVSARTNALLAGDPIDGSAGVAALREEREPVVAAIAQLDRRITAIHDERNAAAAREAQRQREADLDVKRNAAARAQRDFNSELAAFVFDRFPELLNNWRNARGAAADAAARAGTSWSQPDLFLSIAQGTIVQALEQAARAERRFFE